MNESSAKSETEDFRQGLAVLLAIAINVAWWVISGPITYNGSWPSLSPRERQITGFLLFAAVLYVPCYGFIYLSALLIKATDLKRHYLTLAAYGERYNKDCISGFCASLLGVFFPLAALFAVIKSIEGLKTFEPDSQSGYGLGIVGLVLGLVYSVALVLKFFG
jgi:hypothetical protein